MNSPAFSSRSCVPSAGTGGHQADSSDMPPSVIEPLQARSSVSDRNYSTQYETQDDRSSIKKMLGGSASTAFASAPDGTATCGRLGNAVSVLYPEGLPKFLGLLRPLMTFGFGHSTLSRGMDFIAHFVALTTLLCFVGVLILVSWMQKLCLPLVRNWDEKWSFGFGTFMAILAIFAWRSATHFDVKRSKIFLLLMGWRLQFFLVLSVLMALGLALQPQIHSHIKSSLRSCILERSGGIRQLDPTSKILSSTSDPSLRGAEGNVGVSGVGLPDTHSAPLSSEPGPLPGAITPQPSVEGFPAAEQAVGSLDSGPALQSMWISSSLSATEPAVGHTADRKEAPPVGAPAAEAPQDASRSAAAGATQSGGAVDAAAPSGAVVSRPSPPEAAAAEATSAADTSQPTIAASADAEAGHSADTSGASAAPAAASSAAAPASADVGHPATDTGDTASSVKTPAPSESPEPCIVESDSSAAPLSAAPGSASSASAEAVPGDAGDQAHLSTPIEVSARESQGTPERTETLADGEALAGQAKHVLELAQRSAVWQTSAMMVVVLVLSTAALLFELYLVYACWSYKVWIERGYDSVVLAGSPPFTATDYGNGWLAYAVRMPQTVQMETYGNEAASSGRIPLIVQTTDSSECGTHFGIPLSGRW